MKCHLISLFFLLAWITAAPGVGQPLSGSPQILIPAAVSAQGANGTFFRSDITILSLTAPQQTVEVQWLPEAGAGSPVTKTITVYGYGAPFRSSDFVHDVVGQNGLGALLLTAIDATGVIDPNGKLVVTARIWTARAETSGSTSQSFPTVPVTAVHTRGTAVLAGMSALSAYDCSRYRTNAGMVNLNPTTTQTFRVVWHPCGIDGVKQAVVDVAVPPMSMIQIPMLFPPGPLNLVSIINITNSDIASDLWVAYGSTVDNVTGDAWSELAVSP